MAELAKGLSELCNAIKSGDPELLAQSRKEFVTYNWPFIQSIERLAHAEMAVGQMANAAVKLRVVEELAPNISGFFLQRVCAETRMGVLDSVEELAGSAGRLTNDNELYHAVECLISNGQELAAARLVAEASSNIVFSPSVLATVNAKILAASGKLKQAIAVIAPEMALEKPPLIVARSYYLFSERLLDYQVATDACLRTIMQWGDEWDIRHFVERMILFYNFSDASAMLSFVADRYPALAETVKNLEAQLLAAKEYADAALNEHGSVESVGPKDIFSVLSETGISATRVSWGRQALIKFLDSGSMNPEDYDRFAWFIPNWENAQVRNYVLAVARRRFPSVASIQLGWLHYLMAEAAYGDAADQLSEMFNGDVDENVLFFSIALLRLQNDKVAAPFMSQAQFDAIRGEVLRRTAIAAPEFRCVMHEHLVSVGGHPESWPMAGLVPNDSPEAPGFRQLFAISSGRLGRITAGDSPRYDAYIRPVLAISGQLRGFETTWASIYRRLCEPAKAPVVISVWDKTVNATGRHARRLERALPQDVIDQLKPEERYTDAFEVAYPNTYKLLFGQTGVDAAALRALIDQSHCTVFACETENEDLITKLLPPHISPNMLKMYYKFARLEALIRESEIRSGQTYSHVIWSRPDSDIEKLSAADLMYCLGRNDVAWSSFTTETSFGDYVMILPRRAFASIAAIFPRVVTAAHTRLMPWRPKRPVHYGKQSDLNAFGGPDVLFDVLLAAGFMPLTRIPRMIVNLRGRSPAVDLVREVFISERMSSEK